MNTEPIPIDQPKPRLSSSILHIRHRKLLVGYAALLALPFLATLSLNMDNKGLYLSVLGTFNIIAMMAFFVQFPLSSRIKQMSLFANIDWSVSKHKTAGKWLGIFFFVHPLLIIAPRFNQAFTDGITSVIEVIFSPQILTGLIAWLTMFAWVLMAIFKSKMKVSYEIWRLTHVIGFIIISVLATLHITNVGSHGQFEEQFNALWYVLCTVSVLIVIYNHFFKKLLVKSKPFKLIEVAKVSSRDWQVTIEKNCKDDFDFEAGQFVWMNTSKSVFSMNEHPFSIASCKNDLPRLSMVIRELGDYTSQLGTLSVGQDVFIDGPYGSMNLADSKKSDAIVFIAGGAGIGPMLSLLKELAFTKERRPVRLIYGNGDYDQMVLQEEIKTLEKEMPDFCQQLVCVEPTDKEEVSVGVIDKDCINKTLKSIDANNCSVYLCGPENMITSVKRNLKSFNISSSNIHYEQLSF